jgi:hypothetical protein
MPFDIDLVSAVAPFGGHNGRMVLKVKHTGAYTRGGVLDLSSMLPNGVVLEQVAIPSAMRFVRTGAQLAIQPAYHRVGPVTACTASGGKANLTINPHYLLTGERVRVRSVLGSTEVVGEWGPIGRTSASVFTLPGISAVTAFSTSADSIVEVERPLERRTILAIDLSTEVLTTSSAHGLSVGDLVTMTAIGGATPSFDPTGRVLEVATVPSTTTLTIRGLTFSGSAFSGTTYIIPIRSTRRFGQLAIRVPRTLAIASATIASPSVITTQETHNFQVGDRVTVTGVLDATVGGNLNGHRRVRTVPSGTTLTLETEAGAVVNSATGTNTANTGLISTMNEVASAAEFYDEGVWEFTLLGRRDKLIFTSPTKW